MNHPSSLDLEAFACGETSLARQAGVGAHLEGCAACEGFVAELRQLVASGPSAAEAEARVARALERVAGAAEPIAAASPPGAHAPRPAPRLRDPRRSAWLAATSVASPLAAAALILLLARRAPPVTPIAAPGDSTSTPSTTSGPDRILIAPYPGATGASPSEPETTFKGGTQLAVVRERGGGQARFSSAVRVRPGDRLRVEVALDREQAILGAVLGDDGTYLELMPQGVRGPGTHFSERSAKIDGLPMSGTIVIGPPEAVARARETKRFFGVTSLRVEWEGGP
jgi:hypothetical protein